MTDELKELYATICEYHDYIYTLVSRLKREADKETMEANTDCAFVMRECAALLKSSMVECNNTREQNERLAAFQWLQKLAEHRGGPIKTEFCSATVNTDEQVKIPKYEDDPIAYNEMCDWLAIDPNLRDRGVAIDAEIGEMHTEVVRVHWPGLQSYIQDLARSGYSLPPCLQQMQTWTKYTLALRANSKRKLERRLPSSEPSAPAAMMVRTEQHWSGNPDDIPF